MTAGRPQPALDAALFEALYLRFEDLAPLCSAGGRWSFFCVIAPLRLPHGTGSPVNPLAVV